MHARPLWCPAPPGPAWPLPLPCRADIGQFHTWLLSKRPDGQPIYLLNLLPGYPLLNFALVTASAQGPRGRRGRCGCMFHASGYA